MASSLPCWNLDRYEVHHFRSVSKYSRARL